MGAKKKAKEWTPAGAARAARDARVATVTYLSRTDLARTAYAGSLMREYDIKLRTFGGNQHMALLSLFGGMGYDQPPKNWHAAAETVLADEARNLGQAQLYVLSPSMCDVVIAAAQTLTVEDLELFEDTDLPTPTGLLMLPEPLIVRAVDGALADLRALTWTTPATAFLASPKQRKVIESPAARVSAYYDTYGPVRPDGFLEFQAHARSRGITLPPLHLDAIRTFAFDHSEENDPDVLRRGAEAARAAGDREREAMNDAGMDSERVIGEYEPGSTIADQDGSLHLRLLAAFWRLCAQRIGEQSNAPLTHSAKITAQRTGAPPDVRVVQVRTPERSPDSGDERSVDWQHRWVVRMHKVRQWYPSLNTHKIIYRGPYVKGPANKPLLGGDVVRAVSR